MKNVLITGVSSGIGKALTKLLIAEGFRVWGIARRKELLLKLKEELHSDKFFYTASDIKAENFWDNLIKGFNKKNFVPQEVVFNAAVNENDLVDGINLEKTQEMMEVNFFSILKGVEIIIKNYSKKLHFIAISSTSAFKGNHKEGIGYAASKGALSIAFESLFQKYFRSRVGFTTVFFGPVKTGMIRFIKAPPLTLTADKAAEYILNAINEGRPFYHYPKISFFMLSLMRLLPNQVFFKLWINMQKSYTSDANIRKAERN